MEFDTIIIHSSEYRKLFEKSEFSNNLGDDGFDKQCGIEYVRNESHGTAFFKFKIVDKRKWFLAKIKYGI